METKTETIIDDIDPLADLTDSQKIFVRPILAALGKLPDKEAVKEAVEDALKSRESKLKRMLQKIVSAAMGVFNDSDWW